MSEQVTAIGITDHELVALVDMDATPAGLRALEAVGVRELLDQPSVVRAGYSTLLVRDLAGLDGDEIVAPGVGGAIATILSGADDIVQLVLTRGDAVFGRSVLVDAEVGGVLLDMTSYGVHAAQPISDVDLLVLVHDIIANLGDAEEVPFGVQVTRFPVDGESRSADLTVAEPRLWAVGDGDPVPDAEAWASACRLLGRSDAEASSAAKRFWNGS